MTRARGRLSGVSTGSFGIPNIKRDYDGLHKQKWANNQSWEEVKCKDCGAENYQKLGKLKQYFPDGKESRMYPLKIRTTFGKL